MRSPDPFLSRHPKQLAETGAFEAAERLLAERRLWKFEDGLDAADGEGASDRRTPPVPPGFAGALVLEGAPEPHRVLWNRESWSCECGASSPCVHLAALLLRLVEKRPEDERLESVIDALKGPDPEKDGGRESDPRNPAPTSGENPAAEPGEAPSDSRRPDLLDDLDPNQDLLFFSEPVPVETRDVVLLGPSSDVEAALADPLAPSPDPCSADTADTEETARKLTSLAKRSWSLIDAESVLRHDGGFGRFRRKRRRPSKPNSSSTGQAPGDGETRGSAAFRAINDALLRRPPPMSPAGRPWTVAEAKRLVVRFDPLLSTSGDEPLYEPVVVLEGAENRPNRPAQAFRGDIFTGSGDLIMLDADSCVAARLAGAGEDLWFLRLVLSRRVMSASDVRARFGGSRGVPEGIGIELPDLPETLEVLEPTPVLEIVGKDGHTDFLPRWKYAGILLSPGDGSDIVMDRSGLRPVPAGLRNRDAESAALEEMERILAADLAWRRGRYSFLSGGEPLPFRMEADMADVLADYAGPLMDAGVEIRLENRPIRRGGALGISAAKSGGLIEINAAVASEDLELDEWLERGGLVRTRDSYFQLTGKALDQLRFLRDHGMDGGGFLTTSPDNLSLIDAVYEETVAGEDLRADLERRRELYRELADFSPKGAPPPPDSFRASLRPYQMIGYAWLLHLGENGLGACLADDMGLGKTVQTLAYLSRLHADGRLGRVLLVGPVVTLANWEAEIRRFAPALSLHRYSGPAEKRFLPAEDSGTDIVLVSYQTLRNDAEKFLDRDWDHVVLDEAHYVKNASSKIFKTVRSLRASRRISLTGTPLENHLNELWSQMTFLNPGILGSQARFTETYVRPVEFGTDDKAISRLSNTVAPFILRRKKEEVLDDLPPKDETVLRCDMTDDQAEAYDSMRDLYQRQVTGLISRDGLEGSRIEILSILSKLRLLAIHPPLAGEPFAGVSSGKMAVLDNLLEEILEEDHKMLVFSQFLGALDRAEATCRKQGWRFSRLTGSTKDRPAQIKDFNEDPENRVFLLSLKAGGVGINLTAADYVVLIDPWWNPAVEAQAVDRAHRMGQTRPVMAYRLITSGTIEEKVLDLQERKKDLISGVLGDGGVPKLSEEDILGLLD